MRERLGDVEARAWDRQFHLPRAVDDAVLRLPAGGPAEAHVADRRLVQHVEARSGDVAEVLEERRLAVRRGRADVDPDLVAVVEDHVLDVAFARAVRLDRLLARPQGGAHRDVEMIRVPAQPEPHLPRRDEAVGGLHALERRRARPFLGGDRAIDRRRHRHARHGDRRCGVGVGGVRCERAGQQEDCGDADHRWASRVMAITSSLKGSGHQPRNSSTSPRCTAAISSARRPAVSPSET